MRSALSALVIAAGLVGFGASAQATPVSAGLPAGVGAEAPIVNVQMMGGERRMMRRRMMRREMMHRRMMRRRMMHRGM